MGPFRFGENVLKHGSQILAASELNTDSWAPSSKSFGFSRSGVGPQICISNKFPGHADAAGSETTL